VISGQELDQPARAPRSVAIQLLRWAAGLGILAWVIRANGGWRVLQLPLEYPGTIAVLTIAVLIGAAVEAQRLRVLCSATLVPISFVFSLRLAAVAALFSTTLPGGTGGDVVKLLTLAGRHPGHRAEFVALLFLDRLVGLTSLLLIALVSFALAILVTGVPRHIVAIVLVPAIALLGAVAAVAFAARRGPRDYLLRLVPRRWARLLGVLHRAFETTDLLRRHPGVLLKAFAVSTLGQVGYALAFALASRQLMPDAPPLASPALAFTGLIVNAIPLTPAGIGVGEVAFDTLFRLAGSAGGARLLLCLRIGQLPLAVLGAILYLHRGASVPFQQERAPHSTPPQRSGIAP
jgi:uncharacterized membrane protein YbhN (UPF0104 family)